jgi:hypothetical protein
VPFKLKLLKREGISLNETDNLFGTFKRLERFHHGSLEDRSKIFVMLGLLM